MPSVKANINPELLVWARDTAGLNVAVAAKKMAIKEQQLLDWETNKDKPTINQLRKAAEVYKRPLAVFYLPAKPQGVSVLHDFRRLPAKPGVPGPTYSPELLYEIRKASYRRQVAIDLTESLGERPEPTKFTATLKDDPEDLGIRLRKYLSVSLADQSRWYQESEALNGWKAAVEAKNILVFQAQRIAVEEMRGFCIAAQPMPAIALNSKDAPAARIFSLIHELTHIILHEDGVCVLSENEKHEVFCNAVAGATLVPKADLLALTGNQTHWTDDGIRNIASKFRVSRQVILRRLLTFSRVTPDVFRAKQAAYEAEALATAKEKEGQEMIVLPHTMAIANSGKLFSRLVLTGYQQEKITSVDASDYLSVRVKQLPKIGEAVFKK